MRRSVRDFTLDKLNLSGSFVGRSEERKTMMGVFRRVRDERTSESIFISGPSGVGKSVLASQLRAPTEKAGGFFIEGKFSMQQSKTPYSAIISACSELCRLIERQSPKERDQIAKAIHHAVGQETCLMMEFVPCLQNILSHLDCPILEKVDVMAARIRLHHAFRRFLEAVSSSRMVVLVCDDLQFADAESCDFIQTNFLSNAQLRPFLLVATCRGGDDYEPAKQARLRKFHELRWPCTGIELENLDDTDSAELVARSLRMEPEEARELANIVQDKTGGNAYFISEFLQSLVRDQHMNFDYGSLKWKWNREDIVNRQVAGNIADMVVEKLASLPEQERNIIAVASYLGMSFFSLEMLAANKLVVDSLSADPDAEALTDETLELILKRHVKVHVLLEDHLDKSRYRFAHDQIQMAASQTIPADKLAVTKRSIGKNLRRSYKAVHDDALIFTIADLMNTHTPFSTEERIETAKLNLDAARSAMRTAAYVSASHYAREGITLLPSNHWQDEYKLSLKLHQVATESAYGTGKVELMRGFAEEVLYHAKNVNDRFTSNRSIARGMMTGDRLAEAFDFLYNVLEKDYGVRLRRTATRSCIFIEMVKTKMALAGKSDDMILSIPTVNKPRRNEVFELVWLLCEISTQINPNFVPIMAYRMARFTLKKGHSPFSCYVFAMYASLCCSVWQNFEEGFRFAKLAETLLERTDEKNNLAIGTQLINNSFVHHWKRPAREFIRPFFDIYRTAMQSGNVHYGTLSLVEHCEFSFITGTNLVQLESESRAYIQHLQDYHQGNNIIMLLPVHQISLNLLGESAVPSDLSGETMDFATLMREQKSKQNQGIRAVLMYYQLIVAYLFNDIKACRKLLDQMRFFERHMLGHFTTTRFQMFKGLVAVRLASLQFGKWEVVAKRAIEKVKNWAKKGNLNVVHIAHLLEAEMLALKGKLGQAKAKYDLAISTAGKSGYINDKALAYERAGMAHLKARDKEWAKYYLDEASKLYGEWGAKAKVEQLQGTHSDLFRMENELSSSFTSDSTRAFETREFLIAPDSGTVKSSIVRHHL